MITKLAEITITTDATIAGTKLMVDGKDITKKEKVVSISLYTSAPFKSSYSGETIKGYSSCSYEVANEDGTIERKSYGTTETDFTTGIGTKIKSSDAIIRFIGHETDKEITDLVDTIIKHCTEKEIPCRDKNILLDRTLSSLTDMASDLDIIFPKKENEDS